jgi:hypothetical protein
MKLTCDWIILEWEVKEISEWIKLYPSTNTLMAYKWNQPRYVTDITMKNIVDKPLFKNEFKLWSTVKIIFSEDSIYHKGWTIEKTLENITEIHYNYPSFEKQIAFESDIDSTGYTYATKDIKEFGCKMTTN